MAVSIYFYRNASESVKLTTRHLMRTWEVIRNIAFSSSGLAKTRPTPLWTNLLALLLFISPRLSISRAEWQNLSRTSWWKMFRQVIHITTYRQLEMKTYPNRDSHELYCHFISGERLINAFLIVNNSQDVSLCSLCFCIFCLRSSRSFAKQCSLSDVGTTPIRQQYKYPVHLPRTEDQRKLLQMFKDDFEVPTTPKLASRVRQVLFALHICNQKIA